MANKQIEMRKVKTDFQVVLSGCKQAPDKFEIRTIAQHHHQVHRLFQTLPTYQL